MKARRSPSQLIRKIIFALKEKPMSLRALDIHLNTSSRTIKGYVSLLSDLGIVKLEQIIRSGRTVTIVGLTELGEKLKV